VGLPLLLGGLGLGWATGTQRDDDGFFNTATEPLTTETVALSSEAVNLGESGTDDWWADRDLATVRLSARLADASAVFIGIGPSADVARYLGRASYDQISDLRTDPFDYSLTRRGTGGDLNTAPIRAGVLDRAGIRSSRSTPIIRVGTRCGSRPRDASFWRKGLRSGEPWDLQLQYADGEARRHLGFSRPGEHSERGAWPCFVEARDEFEL
jgi:hypothetical protein